MKTFLSSVVIVLAALPATAGLTYDLHTVTNGPQASEQVAHATVDGANVRLEFATGDGTIFKNGAVAVSRDGGATLDVLDPEAKTFFEFNFASLMPGLTDMIKMTNDKVSVRDGGDGGVVEGFSTHHSTVNADADLSVANTTMHLQMTIDSWTTDRFPAAASAFLQSRNMGLPMLDKLLAEARDAMKGFPLKQVSSVKMLQGGTPMIEITTTTTITNVKQKAVAATAFAIPADYKKVPNPIEKMMGQ